VRNPTREKDFGETKGETPAIVFQGVAKNYAGRVALVGIDLVVPEGGCFGLLGPNGAGKTTLVRTATTLSPPDKGTVKVFGHDIVKKGGLIRKDIGLVFQETCLDRHLSVREHLELHARLYRLPRRTSLIEESLRMAGLADFGGSEVRELSGGMARRLEIARGLMHKPRILFLDEPTVGLDVVARRSVWEQIRELILGSTTVVLTTHDMEEADFLCDRLAVIDAGVIVAVGTPDDLKRSLGGDVITLRLDNLDGAEDAIRSIQNVREVTRLSGSEGLRIVVYEGSRCLADLLEIVRPNGVRDVRLERPTLETVFLNYTGHYLGDRNT
jgi:ABC-2 type transport system ATP-binding protein